MAPFAARRLSVSRGLSGGCGLRGGSSVSHFPLLPLSSAEKPSTCHGWPLSTPPSWSSPNRGMAPSGTADALRFENIQSPCHIDQLTKKLAQLVEALCLRRSSCRPRAPLLGWSRAGFLKKSRTGIATIQQFEWGGSNPRMQTVLARRQALQQAGVMFIEDDGEHGPGVRLRDSESPTARKEVAWLAHRRTGSHVPSSG